MTGKKLIAFLAVLSLLALAVLGGGCGGGGSSGGGSNKAKQYVMLGTVDTARVADSNLYSRIEQKLTGTIGDDFDFETLGNGDIIFLADASEQFDNMDDVTRRDVFNAYFHQNVALVAIYPDSDDVDALSAFISVALTQPVSDDGTPLKNPHYEYIGASYRTIGSEGGNTFLCPMDHEDNLSIDEETDEFQLEDGSVLRRRDFSSTKEYITAYLKRSGCTDEQIEAFFIFMDYLQEEFRSESAEKIFEWASGVEQKAKDIEDDFTASASALKARVAAEEGGEYKKLQGIVKGTTISLGNPFSMEFCAYYDKFKEQGTIDGNFTDFMWKCGGDGATRERLGRFWGPNGTYASNIPVKHNTDIDLQVHAFHSFEKQADYYLVTSTTITQPKDLYIAAATGVKNHDELTGLDYSLWYHYGLIFGGNKGLSTKVWVTGVDSKEEGLLKKYLPDTTANNETEVRDMEEFKIGGGISATGGVDQTTKQTTQGSDMSTTRKLSVTGSFTFGITHQTTKTWKVKDYSITPAPYWDDDGNRVAMWNLDVTWPEYQSDASWKVSEAFYKAVSMYTESIWGIPSKYRDKAAFHVQVGWINGFCWAHKMPSQSASNYHVGVQHWGTPERLNLPLPPRIGVDGAVTTGGNEGKMYTAKLYSDEAWTATVNKEAQSWLTLAKTSGTATNGGDFSYTVAPNTAKGAQARVGVITITADDGKYTYTTTIEFTQSQYAK